MRRGLVVSCLLLAFLAPLRAGAERPSGGYAIFIGGDQSISLPTEVEGSSCETEDGTTICFSGAIATDGTGAVTGSALVEISGDFEGGLQATLTGTVSGSTANTRVHLAMDMVGELSSDGAMLDVEARGRFRCAESATLTGFLCRGRMRLCVFEDGNHVSCESERVALGIRDGGGPWLLWLELATGARGSVSGTALVALATGQILNYDVAGKYQSRTDTANLRLSGTGDAQGSKLELSKVSLSGGTATGGRLGFRIAGQTGRTPLPAPPTPTDGGTFPGHGVCIQGGFCDTNADTANLFAGQSAPATFPDTIFFPILSAASRSRLDPTGTD